MTAMAGIPRSPVERYYSQHYTPEIHGNEGFDQFVFTHANGLLVVGISSHHALSRSTSPITQVDFNAGRRDRLDNKVSGKAKMGAQQLDPKSVLCQVTCEDGATYSIYSGVKGSLLEANGNLVENPQLLRTHPESDGFVAIINPPKHGGGSKDMPQQLTPEQYASHVAARAS